MKENQASFTAIMVVYIRAYQTKHKTSKIFGDSLAHHLPGGKSLIEQYLTPWDEQLNDSETSSVF